MKKTITAAVAILLVIILFVAISLKKCTNNDDNNNIGTLQTTTLTLEEKNEIILTAKMFNKMLETMKAEANTERMKKFFSGEVVTYAENDDNSIYDALLYMERWYEVRLGLEIEKDLSIVERAQQLRQSWELVKSYHIVDKDTPIDDNNTGKGGSSGNSYVGGGNKKPVTTTKKTVKPTQNQSSSSSKNDVNIDIDFTLPNINIDWPNIDITKPNKTDDPLPKPGVEVTNSGNNDPDPNGGQSNGGYDDPAPKNGYQKTA